MILHLLLRLLLLLQNSKPAAPLDEKADVVFSNAVFHWIDEKDQQAMLSNIYRNLFIAFSFPGLELRLNIHQEVYFPVLLTGFCHPFSLQRNRL